MTNSIVARVSLLMSSMLVLVPLFQNCSQFGAVAASHETSSASSVVETTPTPAPTPSPTPTTLVFEENFDSAISWYNPVSDKGTWVDVAAPGEGSGGWGSEFDVNHATNTMGFSPFTVKNGIMSMWADVATSAEQAKMGGRAYKSSAIKSSKTDFGYGYYEMSAQMPGGSGMWPAFWLLPGDGGWPPEIDIVEFLGNSPTIDFTTTHSTVNFSGANDWGHWQLGAAGNTGVDLSKGFHKYAANFTATKIEFYFDDRKIFETVTPADLVGRKVFIILDLAINGWGNSGNIVDANTVFPAEYKIDYIRVYSVKPDSVN